MFLNWLDPDVGSLISEWLLLFGIALVISMIGFYRVVYLISIGYSISIVAMAVITPIRHIENFSVVSAIQNIILLVWGARLGLYLFRREFSIAYRKRSIEIHEDSSGMSPGIKILIWLSVSFLYVLMFSPSLFRLSATPVTATWNRYILDGAGLILMGFGLALEAVGDRQKSNFKSKFPGQFCNVGIYRWVRCPNYLGEILV